MKTIKKIFSLLLCIALLLSSAPILGIGLFKTDASAASYAKKHEKEYYYASGTTFIQSMALGYTTKSDSNKAKTPVTNAGYTLIDQDLNAGGGGDYIYSGYKLTTDITASLKDLRISIESGKLDENASPYTSPENGSTYTVVGVDSQKQKIADGVVDLNKGASGDYLYYFATKDSKAGDPILDIKIDTAENMSGYETVKYLNSDRFNENADANRNTKKHNNAIYTHIKRLPQVDTTGLRSSLASADQALTGTNFTEDSVAALVAVRDAGKVITDAYDNYAAGTASYSTVYTQAKIDSAKAAIDAAIAGLVEKIDSDTAPNVTFYAPETIYLNPSDNQTFQYFYGLDTNGNPEKNVSLDTAAKGARIYFKGNNCEPTNVTVTVQASSSNATSWTSTSSSNLMTISYGGTTFTGATADGTGYSNSAPLNIQCTGGKLNSAVPSGGYSFLKWTAHYVVDGITFETYAYSVCYAPYDKPVAAATRAYTNRGINQRLQQIAWISGVVGSESTGNRTNNPTNFNPIKGTVSTPTNTTNNGGLDVTGDIFLTGTSGTAYLANFSNGEVNAQTQAVAPTGKLVLDSTRFSNLKDIPNLKIGYLLTEVWEGSNSVKERRFGYYFSDTSGISFNASSETTGKGWDVYSDNRGTYIVSDTDKEDTGEKIDREYCRPRLVYDGVWDKEISSSQTVSIKGAARFGTRRDSIIEDNNGNVNCASIVPLEVTVANKSTLRSTVNDAVSKARQQTWYSKGYDVYQNSILAAAIDLGNPARSTTKAAINTAELSRDEGSVTVSYVREVSAGADYNGKIEAPLFGSSSETIEYICGEDVSVTYKDFTGYTLSYYKIMSGSELIAKEPPKADNNYIILSTNRNNLEFKFCYTPNSYAVTYDPNGGSFNGSSEVTSTSALYQSKYSVGSVNGTVQSDPTREGYIFNGWKCDANGTTYKTSDQINWEYMKAVKFTAQWTPVSYTVSYDGNGATSGSTASSTHTYDVEKALTKNGFNREFTVTFNYNDGATATKTKKLTSTFNGWATSANGAKIYDDLQTVSNLTATDGATVTLYANWTDENVAIPEAARANYIFLGWFDQNNIKHEGTITPTSDIQLTARWLEKAKYTVTFECEGVVLQSDTLYVDTMPIYTGPEPSKTSDDDYEYEFSGWSPEIRPVDGNITYVAQFTGKAHDYFYTAFDKKTHTEWCRDCSYVKSRKAHHFETYEYDDSYISVCTDCQYSMLANKYEVKLPSGCKITYSIKPEVTAEYAIATIVAPMQKGDTYFVYWVDGEGNIVGTYRTYSFFVTDECNFTPKYVPLEQYTAARNEATSISRVTGGRYSKEHGTYTIYTEHSVSTTVGSITGHGVIYTTNSAYANSLTVDNDNVTNKVAVSSAATLTGLLAVSDKEISLGDTVWARSYIIDANGNVKYGDVKALTVTASDNTSEIGTLGCESFDLTAINAESDTPADPTDDTPTEQSPIEKIMSILSKLVDFIKKILEFFKISEVIK